jgi:DNA recombination protein RmuC
MLFSEWVTSPFSWLLFVASIVGAGVLYQKNVRLTGQQTLLQQQLDNTQTAYEQAQQTLQTTTTELRSLQDFAIEAKTWQTQLEALQPQLTSLQQQQQQLAIEKASLLTEKEGLLQQLTAQQTLWETQQTEWKTLWDAQLKNHLTEVLTQANQSLKRAATEEEEARLVGFKQLTAPLQKMLEEYEQKITTMNTGYGNSVAVLKNQIELLQQSQHQLVSVLKTNKGAGDWGELQLIRILEFAGLQQGIHYEFQATQMDRSRPDIVVKLPQQRFIVIDAKATQISTDIREGSNTPVTPTVLDEFNPPTETVTPAEGTNTAPLKDEALVKSIKTAVKDLASKLKQYTGYNNRSPEFMILFLPKESLLSQALSYDATLWETAWNQNIVISSPNTLIPLLRMVCMGWHQENLSANVAEVQRLGKTIHEKLCLLTERLEKVQNAHTSLGRAIDELEKPYKGKGGLVSVVNKLEELNVASAKKIAPSFTEAPYLLGESATVPAVITAETETPPLLPVL